MGAAGSATVALPGGLVEGMISVSPRLPSRQLTSTYRCDVNRVGGPRGLLCWARSGRCGGSDVPDEERLDEGLGYEPRGVRGSTQPAGLLDLYSP
jgi:hypothetical protein